jgi:hypothetical protein
MSERDDKRRAPAQGDAIDPDAPPSADEALASERLRDALEGGSASRDATDLDLVHSLRAAWSPDPIDEKAHTDMIDELPTAEELAAAEELRNALEGRSTRPDAAGAELAVALRSAWNPSELTEAEHRAILARCVSPPAQVLAFRRRAPAMRVVVIATSSVLAVAASIVVWIATAPSAEAPLAKARSTQPLFDEPFRAGETSARIDRIAIARASDYRDNRFAKWGVR